jgi:hypothetical protein
MSKEKKKTPSTKKDEPLKIFGSFEDVIKVSVSKKPQEKKTDKKK